MAYLPARLMQQAATGIRFSPVVSHSECPPASYLLLPDAQHAPLAREASASFLPFPTLITPMLPIPCLSHRAHPTRASLLLRLTFAPTPLLPLLPIAQSAPLAREYFRFSSGVTVKELPINDGWLRDWGPTVSQG